jgi:hypothetical protein
VPSSRLLSAGRSLALVVFEPRLHELVEFLHLFGGVGFLRVRDLPRISVHAAR